MIPNRNRITAVLNKILFLILNLTPFILCDTCHDDPVLLNEELLLCCKGRPLYSSKFCVDTLLENFTFSQECLVDCMYKEFQIYDGETIDLAAVKIVLDAKISNADFNLVYTKAFERCSRLEKSSLYQMFSYLNVTNIHGCDVYPNYIGICKWYYVLANCPETYASNDAACVEKRHWVKECLLEE